MSSNDDFDRAVRALRETGDTSPADVARTRMRVLETLHRGERRGRRTLWVLLPIAAVLAGSTALAKNNEVVRRVWTSVAETVGIVAPAEKLAVPARSLNGQGAGSRSDLMAERGNGSMDDAPSAASAEIAASADNVAPGETVALPEKLPAARATPAIAPRHHRRPNVADPAVALEVSNPPSPKVEPEAAGAAGGAAGDDAEAASLQLYKQAYRLHFVEQRYAAALAAWDDYLRAAPAGRLVVEARYNRAIALVRLGRRAEAETALAPFARGEVSSGYRAREARELLDALNGSSR
jgi:hypothetical protein